MMQPEYPVYDFLTASKVERPLSAALKVWMGKFCKMFVERWREFSPTDITVSPMLINVLSFESAQSKWNLPSIGMPITIKDNIVHGMVVAQRADLLILMVEILSESLSQRPDDRELTSIELSLTELVFQQAIATFGEAWPEKEMLPIKMGELDHQPKRSRMFPPKRDVLVTGFEIRTSGGLEAGPSRIEWMFAKDELTQLMGIEPEVTAASDQKIPAENIFQIYVDVAAQLGTADLLMQDLLHLCPGDIVKLNQPIERPLALLINEHPTLQAWPGRTGDRQCCQVE